MRSINPVTEQIVGEYSEHTSAQIEEILQRAAGAFAPWRLQPMGVRAECLDRLASEFRRSRDSLSRLMTSEMGKPIVAAESEVDKCAGACEYFAENAGKFLAPQSIE